MESRDPIIVSTETIDIQKDENLLVDLPILDKTGVPSIKSKDDIQKKRVYINIIETSNVTAYKDVERRFNQSHDTDDSLFLAQSYYKKGNFKRLNAGHMKQIKLIQTFLKLYLFLLNQR